MKIYDACLHVILLNEGGYVFDPQDNGGETYAGVARHFEGNWSGWTIIDKIKQSRQIKINEKLSEIPDCMLANFYANNYWNKVKGDDIAKLNPELALHVFDMGVNAGCKTSCILLQRCLGVTDDGIIGSGTLGAIATDTNILEKFLAKRVEYYNSIAHGNNAKFLNGWLKRISNTTTYFNQIKSQIV